MKIHKQEKDRVEVTHKEAVNLQCVWEKIYYQRSRKGDEIACHTNTWILLKSTGNVPGASLQ